jgi:teichuronic acid biosynthesis glycosyltransferase TuaC
VRVCVVAEFYPSARDPVLGVWAHRQALAARDAGVDVHVVVLHRPVPPRATPRGERLRAARELLAQPRRAELDGLPVDYVRFVAPPRPGSYGSWGAWAAPALALHLRRLRRRFAFDLVHAHNAVPAGDAVRRARIEAPLVVSVHGGDVFHTAVRHAAGARAVGRTFAASALVLANSRGIEQAARALGARRTRVVRLGTDVPEHVPPKAAAPTVTTVGHLVARKRHADVLRALWLLRDELPALRYLVVGDGPERGALERLAAELGIAGRVELTGQLPHAEALARARAAHLFAMPSVDEAFGVAYVEAMAAGLPAIGCFGEPGPQEIAEAGDGIRLVPPGDPEALAGAIAEELAEPRHLTARGALARETVRRAFTWERCGTVTAAAYEEALAAR